MKKKIIAGIIIAVAITAVAVSMVLDKLDDLDEDLGGEEPAALMAHEVLL